MAATGRHGEEKFPLVHTLKHNVKCFLLKQFLLQEWDLCTHRSSPFQTPYPPLQGQRRKKLPESSGGFFPISSASLEMIPLIEKFITFHCHGL